MIFEHNLSVLNAFFILLFNEVILLVQFCEYLNMFCRCLHQNLEPISLHAYWWNKNRRYEKKSVCVINRANIRVEIKIYIYISRIKTRQENNTQQRTWNDNDKRNTRTKRQKLMNNSDSRSINRVNVSRNVLIKCQVLVLGEKGKTNYNTVKKKMKVKCNDVGIWMDGRVFCFRTCNCRSLFNVDSFCLNTVFKTKNNIKCFFVSMRWHLMQSIYFQWWLAI